MKDTGKRLCLPYLWVEQPKPQSGAAAGPCTQGEAPLGPHPGRRGRAAGASGSGGFPSKPASSELAPLPHPGLSSRGSGGPGMPETSQNCTCPSGDKPEGVGRLLLSLSVLTVMGVGILSETPPHSFFVKVAGWLRHQERSNRRLHRSLAPPQGVASSSAPPLGVASS